MPSSHRLTRLPLLLTVRMRRLPPRVQTAAMAPASNAGRHCAYPASIATSQRRLPIASGSRSAGRQLAAVVLNRLLALGAVAPSAMAACSLSARPKTVGNSTAESSAFPLQRRACIGCRVQYRRPSGGPDRRQLRTSKYKTRSAPCAATYDL